MKKLLVINAIIMMFFSVTMPVHAQQMKAGVQIGAAIPVGDWGDWVSTGFGGIGTFHYELKPEITLTGAIGYYSFGSKNDISDLIGSYGDYSYSVVPIVAGARYNLGKNAEKFMPYVGAELGFYLVSSSWKVSYWGYSADYDHSETEFGFSPMVGFKYNLQKNLDLDVNAKYSIISDIGQFVVNAGVVFGL